MSDTNTLLLVDGSSYLYRAYHALPDLRGPDNFPTGALHGMVAMLTKLRAQFPAAHAVCVFDAPGKTFRDDLYAEYKANRASMPEPLVQQIGPIHEVVKLLGWPVLTIPGIEADDVIGTLARTMAARGGKVIVSTGDKDMAQLVDDKVTLINTMSNESLDPAGVQAKFGVPPERIVDYLSLIGDTVDNVPGVEKVGPKTAAKWLAEHGSLDGVMAAAPGIKGVAGENLRKALDWLPMGRQLVTIRTDCDLVAHVAGWPAETAFEALKFAEADPAQLLAFYNRYGFKTMGRELEARMAATKPAPSANGDLFAEGPGEASEPAATACEPLAPSGDYQSIVTWAQLDAWLARLRSAPLAAIDTETDSLDPMRARIVGISFALQAREAAYIPLAHNYADAPDQLPLDEVLARLQPWLEDEAAGKIGQNIKYDSHVFANHGITVRGWRHDTLLQSYVIEAHKPHSLESLADRHLGRKGLSYEDICGKGAKQIPFAQVDVQTATT